MNIDDLYKGYVETNGKVPVRCKLTDEKTYMTIDRINAINPKSYAGVLKEDIMLIDFDDMMVLCYELISMLKSELKGE